jgi:hypothetical protein
LGEINLFLATDKLGVLNVEAFIRLKTPCQVFAAKRGRIAALDINIQ